MLSRSHRLISCVIALTVIVLIPACSLKTGGFDISEKLSEIPDGVFYVDPKTSMGEISPLVYGVNHGPWAFLNEEIIPLAQDAGLTLIRFPGGNWGDENDLQTYHIDQFVAQAQQLDCEVFINVRLYKGTPEKAADLVRYANIEKGYEVKYWGIGNEPTLYVTSRKEPDYGVERFNQEWHEIAEAMKAVDPSILLIGPELHQFGSNFQNTPKDPFGMDWMTEFLKSNGDLVDIISIHRYPYPQGGGGQAATIGELSTASSEWDLIIPYLRSLIEEHSGRNIPIAVTEVNSHWSNAVGGEATPDSFYNAIWWSDVLGRMIFNRVEMVTYFSLQSNPSIGGYGLFSRSGARPTYYAYKMYQQFGNKLVFSGTKEAQVGVYAALDSDKVLTVMLVNLSPDNITRPLVIEGRSRELLEVWILDADHMAEQLDASQVINLAELELPAQSVTLLKFR